MKFHASPKSPSPRDLEMLSAYLDGHLNARDQAHLNSRLHEEPALKTLFEELTATRQLLRKVPVRRAPRSFVLTPRMIGVPPRTVQRQPPRAVVPALSFVSVLASLAFVAVIVGEMLGLGRLLPLQMTSHLRARRRMRGGRRHNRAEAQRVGAEIQASGGTALVLQADVTQSREVAAMVKAVLERWGTIDILLNGAGGFHKFAPITEIDEQEWDRVITLNLKTTFLCCKAVAGTMMEKKKGRIISIASGSGISPNPYAPSYLPYGSAKAGVIGLTKILAKELGPYGITVNTVVPGTTLTPPVAKVRDAAGIERIPSLNPMRHLVEPRDTAEAVLFLASDDARYITGVSLNVNAGNIIF